MYFKNYALSEGIPRALFKGVAYATLPLRCLEFNAMLVSSLLKYHIQKLSVSALVISTIYYDYPIL